MKGYPTDEELNLLIEQLEAQQLYAPKHLKEDILNKAFPKQTAEGLPQSKSSGKRSVQVFTYRLKIIAGMAAALFVLMLIPMQAETKFGMDETFWQRQQKRAENIYEESDKEDRMDVNEQLNYGARMINEKMNSWFSNIGNINNLFNMDDGGNE